MSLLRRVREVLLVRHRASQCADTRTDAISLGFFFKVRRTGLATPESSPQGGHGEQSAGAHVKSQITALSDPSPNKSYTPLAALSLNTVPGSSTKAGHGDKPAVPQQSTSAPAKNNNPRRQHTEQTGSLEETSSEDRQDAPQSGRRTHILLVEGKPLGKYFQHLADGR